MVIGGKELTSNSMIDLSPENKNFRTPAYPLPVLAPIGTFIQGKIIVCGGKDTTNDIVTVLCFTYVHHPSRHWEQTVNTSEARVQAESVNLNDTHWWVTGGQKLENVPTEIYNTESNTFSPWVDTPMPDRGAIGHQMVKLNATSIFFGPGTYSNKYYQQAFIFNLLDTSWHRISDFKLDHRSGFAGLVPATQELVVLGGKAPLSYFEVLDVSNHLGNWTNMGTLFNNDSKWFRRGGSVQYQDSFLVYGGTVTGVELFKKVLKYEPELRNWTDTGIIWSQTRAAFASFLVPREYFLTFNGFH